MIDYSFALLHRRLRGRFHMATLDRHAGRLMAALYKRARGLAGCNHWPGQKRCGVCGMGNPVVDQSELAGSQQMEHARPPLRSCAPNSGFDSRDGGQS